MSRPGVTYLDVAQAATQLIEKNGRPTIEEVRKLLGRGSHSTINRHLRDWRERQGNQLAAEQGLPDSLLIAVKGLYAALQGDAQLQVDQLSQQHNEVITKLEGELATATQQQREQAQSLASLSAAHQELEVLQRQTNEKLLESQQTLELKKVELTTLSQRLDDRQLEVGRLLHEASQAQRNLDHYRETVRQHREEERSQHQAAIAQLTQQIVHCKAQLQASQEQQQALQQQLADAQHQYQASLHHCAELTQQQLTMSLRSQELEAMTQQLHQRLAETSAERDELKASLTLQQHNLQETVVAFERCQAQLAYVTASLQQLDMTNRELADRNLFLVQENASLTAQFKLIKT